MFQVVRFDPKTFKQRRPIGNGKWAWNVNGVGRVLYHLPEVLKGETILICEGEKDVETAREMGLIATCNAGGAGKWREEYSAYLWRKRVVIIADADEPGRKHAQQVAVSLTDKCESVKLLELPGTKDLTEWVEKGGTREALLELIRNVPEWKPQQRPGPGTRSSKEPKPPAPPFRTAAQIEEEVPPEVEWVAKPYVIMGAITEVDGKVKLAGKTTFVTNLCAAVLNGARFLGQRTMRSPIVYLTEQPPSSWRQALGRAGLLGRQDFYCLYFKDIRSVAWGLVANEAVAHCKRIGAKLLVVDTLSQFAGINEDKENNSGDALQAMGPLQAAAGDGIAVIAIRHERKSGGGVGDSARGSSAYGGAADVIVSIRRPEGNTRKSLRVLQAIGRFDDIPAEMVIELTSEGYVSLGNVADLAAQEAETSVIANLPADPEAAMKLDEIVKATEKSRTTVQRAVDKLRKDGRIQSVGNGKKSDPFRYYIHSAQTSAGLGGNNPNSSSRPNQKPEPGAAQGVEPAENDSAHPYVWSLGGSENPSSPREHDNTLSHVEIATEPSSLVNGVSWPTILSAQTTNPIGAERNESTTDKPMLEVEI